MTFSIILAQVWVRATGLRSRYIEGVADGFVLGAMVMIDLWMLVYILRPRKPELPFAEVVKDEGR